MTQQEAVEDRPRGIIEVGDEIRNYWDQRILVSKVIPTKHGLLVFGDAVGLDCNEAEGTYRSFFPPELPAIELTYPWKGWMCRGFMILPKGERVGSLGLYSRGDPRNDDPQEYDAEWERTPQEEPMQCRPTPYRVD